MFDYLAESVAVSFIVGGILGALLTLQLVSGKLKPMAQKRKDSV